MLVKDKVSVVIPTFDRPTFLSRAIDSVLNQTYKNIEIIVVDDNNPETEARIKTENLMEKYVKDKRIIYIRHAKNKNGAAARNTGIKSVTGEYITFLDDDDEMGYNRISLLHEKLSSLDLTWGACYSNYSKMKKNNEIQKCGESRSGNLYVKALMRSLYIGSGSNLFIRSSVVKEINGFDEDFNRNQDLEFLARVLKNYKLAFISCDTLIIHYEDKVSGKFSYEKLIELDELFLDKFSEEIVKLPKKDRNRINKYFALERFRNSIKAKKILDGLGYCIANKVDIFSFVRYCIYMIGRVITKKSFGFKI